MGSFASLFLKKASGKENIIELLKNRNIYIGGLLYLIAALLNIYILKYLEYSVVLPLTAITYIWTLIISHKLLKEKISKKKICGVCLIVVGVIFIAIQINGGKMIYDCIIIGKGPARNIGWFIY